MTGLDQRQPQGKARLSVRGLAGQQDRRRALRQGCGGARRGRRAGAARDGRRRRRRWASRFIADENPRLAAGAHGRRLLWRAARYRGRRHRHQGQILHRRVPARDLDALGKPAASLGTVGVVAPKGEIPLDAHHARSGGNSSPAGAAEAGRHRSSRHRGLQPWSGPIPSRRRRDRGCGLHQHHPRSYGLSRQLRALPRRQAAAVQRSGARRRRCGRSIADAEHADAFIAAAQGARAAR